MDKSRTPQEIRSALIGTLLGDSYITSGRTFGCTQISRDLIEVKAKLVSHYTKNYPKIHTVPERTSVINGRTIYSKEAYVVRGDHPRFRKWHKLFYSTGNKQVNMKILNRLNEEGIAMWIMDDGYLDYKRSNHTRNIRLCTDSFDDISHECMQKYFKREFNIDTKIYMHIRGKNCTPMPRLSFNASNSQKLVALVYPYMLDSFLYKIDLKYLPATIKSKRCSSAYVEAHECISERMARLNGGEDIV